MRSKKRLRTQDDEEKELKSVPTPMATPLEKNQIKKSDKGKKPMNQEKEKGKK